MKHFSKPFRRILTLAAVAAMLVGTAAAASITTKRMIEANYSGIKLVVDGVEVTPKDAAGNAVEPFISAGTTYLPVRAVGEALGKEVTWDGNTRTVYIGQVPGVEESWMTKLPPYKIALGDIYDGSDRKASFSVAGVEHKLGVTLQRGIYENAYAIWNTNGQYRTMTLTLGCLDSAYWDGTLEIYLDGEYSTEYELKWDAAPKTLNIPLKYTPNVKLEITGGGWGIYDISFD